MINEEKSKNHDKACHVRTGEGKYLPISKFYRSDYIGRRLLKTFFSYPLGMLALEA